MKKVIFKHLPKWAQQNLIRRTFTVEGTDQNEIQYKLAESEDEFKQAFRLVHENYVKLGFIQPEASGLRMLPHHQLDTTAVIVAKKDGIVIGTVTLVREGALELPMEKKFNLGKVRSYGTNMAEVTCLAVDENFRRANGGKIFPGLLKFMYEFAVFYFDVAQLVIAVYPKDAVFYQSLFCFSVLDEEPVEYYGAPAIGLHIDLQQVPAMLKKTFGNRRSAKNLFHFFIEAKLECFAFPQKVFDRYVYPHATAVVRQIAKQLPQAERIHVLHVERELRATVATRKSA